MSSHSHEKPMGGPWVNKALVFFGFFVLVGLFMIGKRLFFGIGAVSGLNGGYPWGIWIAYDLITATGFACGGWGLAWAVYVFNKGRYHPLVRSALIASIFGYSLGGLSIMIDIGRWWNVYYIFLPWQFNLDAVLLETALCMTVYIFVMIIEFLPAVLERLNMTKWLKRLDSIMFLFISLGALLPTMHQSSMGSIFIAVGYKLHPLWQAMEMMPLFAILTAFILGFSIVIFEGSLVRAGFKGRTMDETGLFQKLIKAIMVFVVIFLTLRIVEIVMHDKVKYVFTFDYYSILFLVECMWFVLAFVLLSSKKGRENPVTLFLAALCIVLGAGQWRMTYTLLAFDPGNGYAYFPTFSEILISFGFIAIEVVGYILAVKFLPILHPYKPKQNEAVGKQTEKAPSLQSA